MQVAKLKDTISKYNLNGTVESVILKVSDNILSISAAAPDKTLIETIVVHNFELDDCEIGIFDTDKLSKVITIFTDDIEVSLNKVGDKVISFTMEDTENSVNFVASDTGVIPVAPKSKSLPPFDIEIPLSDTFIKQFNKAKSALPDIGHVTFDSDGKQLTNIIFGYSKNNTTRITYPLNTVKNAKLDNMSFNSNYLKAIFAANSGLEGKLSISTAGLLKVEYIGEGVTTEYYLVQVQHI